MARLDQYGRGTSGGPGAAGPYGKGGSKPGRVSVPKSPRKSKASTSMSKKVVKQARAGLAFDAKGKTVGSSVSGKLVPRTKAVQKFEAKGKRWDAANARAMKNSGVMYSIKKGK